ncbi:hypothetical protein [Daejeonella sp.]|uniref:hypothetical protein n=1 Tax=Daejeonella sp. TaxID=2805397 RepID=UPI0030C63627
MIFFIILKAALLYFVIIFCALIAFSFNKATPVLPKADPKNGGLFLPGNFEMVVVTDSLGPTRRLAVNDNGDVYVKLLRLSAKKPADQKCSRR